MTDGEERAWDKVSNLEYKVKQLEKEATEFEVNHTVCEVATREDGSDYAKKICNVTVKEAYLAGAEPREKRIEELANQLERAKVYLKATSDLLQKQNESHYVLNLLNTTVFYDEADCDGYCLKDEIDTFLETGV